MKVLMINGSPRKNGNTSIALAEMERIFQEEGKMCIRDRHRSVGKGQRFPLKGKLLSAGGVHHRLAQNHQIVLGIGGVINRPVQVLGLRVQGKGPRKLSRAQQGPALIVKKARGNVGFCFRVGVDHLGKLGVVGNRYVQKFLQHLDGVLPLGQIHLQGA